MKADDVLQDLRSMGAVGAPPKAPMEPVVKVAEVTVEQGPPSAPLVDLRGDRTVAALDDAITGLRGMMREMTHTLEALERLKTVWSPGVEVSTIPVKEEVAVPKVMEPVQALPPSELTQDEAYARAREAAIRKIRGGTSPQGPPMEEDEDNIPFVGQVRVVPMGQEPEEVTIGTVGKIKPSFPMEGKDGTQI